MTEEPISLSDCLDDAEHLLSARAIEKSITIDTDMPANLPKLMGDRRGINQIVINLLTNAVKFTPNGGKVVMSARIESDGKMMLSIVDTGPGIAHAEQVQLLSAFSRGTHATKLAIEGAGLGLPIVKGLLDAHGGKLQIKSELGKGTEVICIFPTERVLSGPRGEAMASPTVKTDTQRKLISITG